MQLNMQPTTTSLAAGLLITVLLFNSASYTVAVPRCRLTTALAVDTKDCRWGTINYCGTRICAKGFGERCSNLSQSPYRCGDGYFCMCGQCQGCSLVTINDCFYQTTNCLGPRDSFK